ncbi:MAG: UTP--glucose-1-phosphate uridylyltransferase [Ilumatobacteraceae bacterium]
MHVHTAVIPAAGLGTRFLPATKVVPKELLPIIEVPMLQLVVDEAIGAGIDHVVVVSNHAKPAVEAYFRRDPQVEAVLDEQGRSGLADRLRRFGGDVRVSFVFQDEPQGLGHAVGCARELVGDEAFAVLLPDEVMADSSLLQGMAELCERTAGGVVALKQVPRDQVSRYGVVCPDGELDADGVVRITDVVEKPAVEDAPSELVIIGRYVLTPDVFDEIAVLRPGSGGELQLTDALRAQARRSPFHGLLSGVGRHDTGNPFGWLCAVVDAGLEHPDLAVQFRTWLDERLSAS